MRAVDGQARRDLKGLYMGLFTGKTVIVTGGGKATLKDGSAGSIGYGIDIAFAKEGANLVITGRNVAKLEAAKESLEAEYGVKVLPVQADVSAGQDNEAVVQNVIDKAIEEFGRMVYYLDQKLDVTDKFDEDGVCYVQLEGGEKTIYMTIKRGNGYATSTTKYILPNEFNN